LIRFGCLSSVADTDQDEALTLASAFLAAGASGVIGALWPVADAPTALLLVMFHHYLKAGPHHPADALRAAQLWMLDPVRRSLGGLSAPLADEVADVALAEVPAWAGFAYQGA
jgi:CHAT domain-containing protein